MATKLCHCEADPNPHKHVKDSSVVFTADQWLRIMRAARKRVIMLTDPNPRLVAGDALQGIIDEMNRIIVEAADNARHQD
jgi:hypothetical protein